MGYPRKSLVSLNDTPYYHAIARCVRRGWLFGIDEYSGKDYSHRRDWVLKRLSHLARVFSIDVCAYAIMTNHYHLVLHIDQQAPRSMSREMVASRWGLIYKMPVPVKKWIAGEATQAEQKAAERIVEKWRARLCDISWYMRCLNEHLARRANAEDECKGRFWEGRFKSQALFDEVGVLTAMAYVDLNPIRAGAATTPERSDFTSIQTRIAALADSSQPNEDTSARMTAIQFEQQSTDTPNHELPFSLKDYLQLVDWTGRKLRKDKAGHIDASLPSIFHRLGLADDQWQLMMTKGGNRFGRAIGPLDRLRSHAKTLGQSWLSGLTQARRLFRQPQES